MTNAERALLLELARWVQQFESGVAEDSGRVSGVAERLRRLIAEVSREGDPAATAVTALRAELAERTARIIRAIEARRER